MRTLDKLLFTEIVYADVIYLDGEMSDADELFDFALKRKPEELKEYGYETTKEGRDNVLRVRG